MPGELPRIVYIHGDGVTHWNWGWVARLQQELAAAGFPTSFQLFPDSIEARAQYWLPFLEEHVRAGEADVLLGWSCGAVAAMRYAQSHRVHGLVLVAPYYTDLGEEVVRRSGFVTEPWDFARIRNNTRHIAMFTSDRDPWISQREFGELEALLAAERCVCPGAGHFSEQEDFRELRAYLMRTYGARGVSSLL